MDSLSGSFLLAIPGFGTRAAAVPDLSPRDKRYLALVEKALATFDTLEEWADYTAFLSRLHKALQLPEDKPHSVLWIPLAEQVSGRLALCLSPQLPNGVHQKALNVYESVFAALSINTLNRDIAVWLPGLLPVISYGSMQVKPQLLAVYENQLLKNLDQSTVRSITKPFVLSLLQGLDDENLEVFSNVLAMLDSFKLKLADNSHFWQTTFLCVITSPEKRIGALNWCNARLPVFTPIRLGTDSKFSAEATACLYPEPGLLVRAFATAMNTKTNFNQATDIIVVRGFFDLLLSHMPLGSEVFSTAISLSDKELLVMACSRITLKKDMSLNRRLWAWFLGPDHGEDADKSSQTTYFKTHALPILEKGILSLVSTGGQQEKLEAYRISLALIMDRWEISQLVTPKLFVPLIEACYSARSNDEPGSDDLLVAAKAFFDEVEAQFIWDYVTCTLIVSGSLEKLQILEFLLRNFKFPEDDRSTHVSMAILCLLTCCEVSEKSLDLLELLTELAHPNLFATNGEILNKADVVPMVTNYYEKSYADEPSENVFDTNAASLLTLDIIKSWFVQSIETGNHSERIATILNDFLSSAPYEEGFEPFNEPSVIDAVLSIPPFEWTKDFEELHPAKVTRLFGIVKLSRHLVKNASVTVKGRLLKVLLSNMWQPLVSSHPANFQMEAVRHIFELKACFGLHHIEAGILDMLLHTPKHYRIRAFNKLWSHSADFNDFELVLSKPLFVILDDILNSKEDGSVEVQRFIQNVIHDGSANRLLQLITDPLLEFPFLQGDKREIASYDDLKLFAYHLETLLNVVRTNEKLLKDSLNHEFVVSESTVKFDIIKNNQWDISNYKSLVVCVVRDFCSLKLSDEFLQNSDSLASFLQCITNALEIYCFLVNGSDADFENLFRLLIDSCTYYIRDVKTKSLEVELVEAAYLRAILHFLAIAKTLSVDLLHLQTSKDGKEPLLVTFIVHGIEACLTPILLEKWFKLLTTSLHLLNNEIFGVILTISDTIIAKVETYLPYVKKFERSDNCTDLESAICILLSGLEDLLSITHSYLLTSNLRATSKAQNGENGFLGNVILGVFLIESPELRTAEENKLYSVLIALQDSAKIAFEVWNWADNKPQGIQDVSTSSKSATYLANKLKFRSRKILECLVDLERQEVIETIIESRYSTSSKIKLLHVLDSGRSQVTLPHILNSIITRCYPQSLTNEQRSSMNSSVTEKQLSEFLVPYYESIDFDTVDDIWDMSILFFKEVLMHPMYYKKLLISYLNVMKVLALKARTKKFGDTRRPTKDLATQFMAILNTSVSRKAQNTSSDADSITPELEGVPQDTLADSMTSMVEYFGDILQDSDKTNTAVTTLISTVIMTQTRSKTKHVDASVVRLMEAIGKHYPNRSWKQVVNDVFMDSSFFHHKSSDETWKSVISLWITNEKEKINELLARVTPSMQSSAANIFIWSESSEVKDRILTLRRITYLTMVLPKDFFSTSLNELFIRLGTALNSDCPPLYKSEAFNLFRAITLRFSEAHLLPHWPFMIQLLGEVFSDALARPSLDFSAMPSEQLQLILSACKLLDQLLLVGFDEFNLTAWLFVASGSVTSDPNEASLIDRLGKKTEALLTKEDPVAVGSLKSGETVRPVLFGVASISNIANLKKFFGLLSYINYERNYGLCRADLGACEEDTLADLGAK